MDVDDDDDDDDDVDDDDLFMNCSYSFKWGFIIRI